MAEIKRASWGVEMLLDTDEAIYVLACLGTSNSSLFPSISKGTSLYDELREALGIAPNEVNEATGLYTKVSDVLEAWHGRSNFGAARKLAVELGL